MNIQTVPLPNLLIMLIPIAAVAVLYWKWVGKPYEIGMAAARMVAQLLVVGYLLTYVFESRSLILGSGILILMITVSSWIARRTVSKSVRGVYYRMLLAIGVGGSVNLFFVIVPVLRLDPLYQPRYLIPLAGMIYANAMNAVSLAAERFEKEFARREGYHEARRDAFKASLIPQINSLLAVGLVALPGMMTGQILSGVSPLIAVRYQIMVMAMILGTAGLSVAIYLVLAKPESDPSSGPDESVR